VPTELRLAFCAVSIPVELQIFIPSGDVAKSVVTRSRLENTRTYPNLPTACAGVKNLGQAWALCHDLDVA
jgi:hypothetical protein